MEPPFTVPGTKMLWGYRFQEQDLLAMRGQELSLHENRQWVWGEQYVLGALVQKNNNYIMDMGWNGMVASLHGWT